MDADDLGRAAQDQLYGIVNTGNVANLLEIVAPGNSGRNRGVRSADPDDQLVVLAISFQVFGAIENEPGVKQAR